MTSFRESKCDPNSNERLISYLLGLNQELLDSIVGLDYDTYDRLCADDMSCIEPESRQNVVIGKAFHRYYFDVFGKPLGNSQARSDEKSEMEAGIVSKVTMVQPHVQLIGGKDPHGAVLSYVKLTQQTQANNLPTTIQQSETRVWECREEGKWVCVHFHKSEYAKMK